MLLNSYQYTISPSTEVPQHPSYYYWETTAEYSAPGINRVTVYTFEALSQRVYSVGSVEVGKEVKLLKFQSYGGTIYYEIDRSLVVFEDPSFRGVVWLPGKSIKRIDEKSFRPPKNWSPKYGLRKKPKK